MLFPTITPQTRASHQQHQSSSSSTSRSIGTRIPPKPATKLQRLEVGDLLSFDHAMSNLVGEE
jgi:hypothetical protein